MQRRTFSHLLPAVLALSIQALGMYGAACAVAQEPAAAIAERLSDFRYGQDRSVLDALDAAVRRALAGEEDRSALAAALAKVASSGSTPEARQAACRRLTLLATEAEVPAMARLLDDPSMASYALMVLARIPGAAPAAALRAALPRLRGAVLIGAMDILGERRDAAATPLLARRCSDPDREVASCAAKALAGIGTPQADRALRAAYERASSAMKTGFAEAMLVRGDALRAAGRSAEALAFYDAVDRADTPQPITAAALRGKVLAGGSRAVPLIVRALGGGPGAVRNMAAALAREVPGTQATRALAEALPRASGPVRIALMQALADRGDRSAGPSVLGMLRVEDAGVRMAAIHAAGALCGASAVPALLNLATSSETSAAASDALLRLRGEGVENALVRAMETGSDGTRAAAIRALAGRGIKVPVDALLRVAGGPGREARNAALDALREYGRAQDLPALVQLLFTLSPVERDAAERAVVAIARRTDSGAAVDMVAAHMGDADVENRRTVAEVVAQIGGDRALTVLTQLADAPDGDTRLAAVRGLAEWADPAPRARLRESAGSDSDRRVRAVAFRGYLRMLAMPQASLRPDQADAALEDALAMAQSADERKLVAATMAGFGSERVLAMAMRLREEEALREEAEQACLSIARRTAGAWPDATRQALQTLAETGGSPDMRKAAADLLGVMDRFGDFVMAWEVSPAYEQEGADFSRLFDVAFPPEEPEKADMVSWQAMPVGGEPGQPWLLDLLAVHGGEQKVAYLRTAIWSPEEQPLVAEIGTDDGLKVWWNGALVHGNNTQRAVAPGQEKVPVTARKGWNRMLLKVTQNVMGWGACVRIARPDGSPVPGLRAMLPSFIQE